VRDSVCPVMDNRSGPHYRTFPTVAVGGACTIDRGRMFQSPLDWTVGGCTLIGERVPIGLYCLIDTGGALLSWTRPGVQTPHDGRRCIKPPIFLGCPCCSARPGKYQSSTGCYNDVVLVSRVWSPKKGPLNGHPRP
jgi:hypothetical protein